MKVLILHNKYQQRGGEDAVAEQELALLKRNSIDADLISISNDKILGPIEKIKAVASSPYSRSREAWISSLVTDMKPDVVHIHNFFPLLTTAVHVGASKAGTAVVQTLHNYRLLCANATFLRDGKVCEDCMTLGRFNAIKHRCYRNSLVGSAAVVAMQSKAERLGIWTHHVHQFIALTQFARSKFIQGGLPAERITVKPNFVTDTVSPSVSKNVRRGGLFVGRISEEKGVSNLLEAWPIESGENLTIVGDGPDFTRLKSIYGHRASFIGHKSASIVRELMESSAFLVVPSIWYEGFPMTIVEAFAAGLPVVGSDIGSLSSIIEDGKNGLKFTPACVPALHKALTNLLADSDLQQRLSRGARNSFEASYSEASNAHQLLNIYAKAIEEKKNTVRD